MRTRHLVAQATKTKAPAESGWHRSDESPHHGLRTTADATALMTQRQALRAMSPALVDQVRSALSSGVRS